MLESEWSDPQSDLTEELGLASKPAVPQPRQRCVVPRVQPSQLNRSDQRVPEYWDQTVPVWQAGGATSKRKAAGSNGRGMQVRSARRLEGGCASESSDTMSVANSGENCCCSSGRDGSSHSGHGDGGASANSSEVSFNAILSMSENSLVEMSFKWSWRDWWMLGTPLKSCSRSRLIKPRVVHDHTRRRLWPRRFAGRRHLNISVQLSASGAALMGEAHDEVESVRRLRVAIERTSICDPASTTCQNSHCGAIRLCNSNARRRRSCDFQNCRDPLSFTTPMLTTSSS